MHHLILLRESDQTITGSGCCGRLDGDAGFWNKDEILNPGKREGMDRVGAIYRAVRSAFGQEVEISILDPRNQITFLPLVVRDAVKFGVPIVTALRTIASTSSLMGVFDGQVLYAGEIPQPDQVVDLIAGRLSIHKVGSA